MKPPESASRRWAYGRTEENGGIQERWRHGNQEAGERVATRSLTSEESQEVGINSEATGDLGEDICSQVCMSGGDVGRDELETVRGKRK